MHILSGRIFLQNLHIYWRPDLVLKCSGRRCAAFSVVAHVELEEVINFLALPGQILRLYVVSMHRHSLLLLLLVLGNIFVDVLYSHYLRVV